MVGMRTRETGRRGVSVWEYKGRVKVYTSERHTTDDIVMTNPGALQMLYNIAKQGLLEKMQKDGCTPKGATMVTVRIETDAEESDDGAR